MTQGFLRIATYDNAGGFLNQAQVALEQDEEENHLILGICRRMRDHSDQITTKPFLATIQADGEDVLAVMMTPPFPLVLARTGSTNLEVYQVLVDHLQREGWQVSEINGPEYLSTEFADLWAAKTGLRKQVGRRQRLYTLTQVEFPRGVSGELRKATSDDLTLVQSVQPAKRYKTNQDGSPSTFGKRSAALEKLIGEPIRSRIKIKFVVTKKPLPGIMKPSKSGVKPIDYMYPVDLLKSKNEIDLDWYKKMIENYIQGAFGLSDTAVTEQTGLDAWM